MNYVLDRMKEAGTYRSLIWMLVSGTQLAFYIDEAKLGIILSALGIIAGVASALMKERKDVTVTAVASPNVAASIEKEKV